VAFPVAKVESGKSKYMMAHVYIHGEMGSAKQVIRSHAKAKYHRKWNSSHDLWVTLYYILLHSLVDVYDELKKEAEAS